MFFRRPGNVAAIALLFLSLLAGCSGGGGSSSGGGGTTPVATPTATVVSGTVQAPGGVIAFFKKPSLSDFFVSEAYAALTGLANVPDGTIVQLARLNATASNFSVITATTTSGGRYSFNLTDLGLQPANDLIVRVAGPSGKEMRAFVTSTLVNLDPVSEASIQVVAAKLVNGNVLSQFTVQELADIRNALSLLVGLNQVSSGGGIQDAVSNVMARIDQNTQTLIDNAAQVGQTAYTVGDIGNLFPLTQGNTWQYQKTKSSGGSSQTFSNSVTRPGAKVVNGVPTLIYRESNPENTGVAQETYLVKDSLGISVHGNDDAADDVTPLLTPYMGYRFPLGPGSVFPVISKKRITVNGFPFDISLSVQVENFEQVTVPVGTFNNALKTTTTQSVIFVQTGETIGTASETDWIVPGIGFVKAVESIQGDGFSENSTSVLTAYNVDGQSGGGTPPPPPPRISGIDIRPSSNMQMGKSQNKTFLATAFDQTNNPIPNVSFFWTSSDGAVASVDATGQVTGLLPGQTLITASAQGVTSNAVSITVLDAHVLTLPSPSFIDDLVYDKVRDKFYAFSSSQAPEYSGRLLTIDPTTGLIVSSRFIGVFPAILALSDDAQYLYIACRDPGLPVRRLNLSTNQIDLEFPLMNDYGVDAMAVVPGNPSALAVSQNGFESIGAPYNNHRGIAIYDNGIKRQSVTPFPLFPIGLPGIDRPYSIAFSQTGSTLYGARTGIFLTASVDGNGATITRKSEGLVDIVDRYVGIVSSKGFVYTYFGTVIDAANHTVHGTLQLPQGGGAPAADGGLNRIFYATAGSTPKVLAFDQTTMQQVSSVDLSGIYSFHAMSLIRWGNDGLAIRAFPNQLIIFRTSLLH